MAYFPYVTFVSVVSFNDIRFVSYIVLKFVGISSKHLRVFLGSLRQTSVIFGHFRKMFGNVRLVFGTILENLRKSSENQKRRHQRVYIIKKKNITRRLEDMNFIFSWQKQYFTHSLRSFVKYCFATRK